MTGPDHSKKPKSVTIDLTKDDVRETATANQGAPATGPAAEPAKPADAKTGMKASTAGIAGKPADAPKSAQQPAGASGAGSHAATTPAKSSGSGFLGKAGAGILGGLVALAGAAGLQYAGKLPSFGTGADVAALQTQVNELAARPSFDPAPLQAALDATNGEIAALKDIIAKLPAVSADGSALQPLNEKIAALEATLASLPAGTGADGAALQMLSAKVAALETAQAPANDASAVALAIAASALKAAIDRGGPFPAELDTYASVAASSADVEALRALAGTGVPSQSDLVAGFNDAANAMISASIVPDPDASILQRLTDSATSLVKTRRVGNVEGDEPDAVVARMEAALDKGDLDGVIGESAKLPDASKAAGKDWLDRVAARRDANTLVTRALGAALKAAGGKS